MPNESVAAEGTPQLPSSLQANHKDFVQAVSGWMEPERVDINVLQLLTKFGLLVREHAERLSLISKRDRSSLFTRHILDSLNPLSLFDSPPASVLDVGSGAGFPGIPLAVVWKTAAVTLVERREKKAAFLERAVRELGLKNTKVVPSRVEDIGAAPLSGAQPGSHASGFESVFIRALGSLPALLGSVGPLCAPGARWVYFLGAGSSADEVLSALGPLGLGGEVVEGRFGGRLLHGRLNESNRRSTGPGGVPVASAP